MRVWIIFLSNMIHISRIKDLMYIESVALTLGETDRIFRNIGSFYSDYIFKILGIYIAIIRIIF